MNMYVVFLQILPLLLGAAISPVAATGMITVLATSNKSTIVKGFVYLLGTAIPLLLIGIPGIFLFSHIDFAPKNTAVSSWIDLVAGLVLLGLAVRVALKTKEGKAKTTTQDSHRNQSYNKLIALGVALMITNFSTLVLFVPAVKDIAISSLDTAQKSILLLMSIAITLVMIFTPLLIFILLPKRSEKMLSSLKSLINRHMREITLSLLIVFGIYLLIKGFGVFGVKA